MKSILIPAPGELKIVEQELPSIGPEEILIKIQYVGFCGSDLSSFLGRNPMVNYPVVPGHEVAGVIEDMGTSVPSHIKKGQAVTLIPYTNCGKCAACLRDRPNSCQRNQTMGVQRDGAMREYIAIHWEKILESSLLSKEELALVEPMTVGFHAASRARIINSDTVAVLGCGIIGAGAIISAVDTGAQVIAVDVDDSKLELARELGASLTLNSHNQDITKNLKSINDEHGPDVIIEAAGQTATYLAAVEAVAFTGRIVCVGYAKEDIAFATKLFVQKELDILGSRNARLPDFQKVINYMENNNLPINKLISMIVSPNNGLDAMQKWAANPGKVMKLIVSFE